MNSCRALCATALMGLMLLTTPARAEPQACVLGCQQKQALCERKAGPRASCARDGMTCERHCRQQKEAGSVTGRSEKKLLCEQRCDLNRSTCEGANPKDGDYCAAGQKSCRDRCG